MPTFTNAHGHPASAPLPADHPVTVHTRPDGTVRTGIGMTRFRQRIGHEPLDLELCQAPAGDPTGNLQCHSAAGVRAKAVCVMVENSPRPNGLIASMSLCQRCADRVLAARGPDYAKFTPI